MSFLSRFFFFTYIGLVTIAGFWGAFINPYFDFDLLFHFDPHVLSDHARINLLSQYRFLRALELGFGLFALLFYQKIFEVRTFNILFLTVMGSGIVARLVSWWADGQPNYLTLFFLSYELLGWIVIFIYTHKTRKQGADR
ncbi:MAG: DUF4345 domain-containing protein [Cyclobacteriaceae bacterium]|nr:DUF4345 domain-containing protein [Cyclobacteriaceae bacterium]